VELDNAPFQKGDQVEVIGGNLTGLKGTLIEKENNKYLSVQLTNIGLSLNVSVAANLLRKIKSGVLV
jgi:transcription antitermination factor NusG